ncbi:MAG TPA: universal stress protein [Methanothermococcus okinawensis]|uniref:Universal stress protein n=1 Tax=Methanothermococcus okinawensis TaxID=155863 RepID=A0A833E3M2_9EURY|nr:universal stress protein [Methanococcaceae archaeon]HIP84459.1 universal stress protein [Methanothermococcus okinawensis]HIP90725.1 universal stress protein [Methanothermococcus okinawensis]
MLYKKILIPTDNSPVSIEAARHGLEIARLMNSKVYVIYVVDIMPFIGLPTEGFWETMREVLEEEGKEAFKKIEEIARELGVKITTEILEGNPAREIVEYGERKGVDLIVMGTSGKSGIDRLLLGSVAEKVSRKAQCPVLLVKMRKKNK